MGCAASKLENEDTVRRCKDRRRLMKEAVYARHHLAAAHSDYCRSLRLTGTALSTFASGEPLSVSDNTPAVFINHKTTTTPTTTTTTFHHPQPPQPKPQPPPVSFHRPPPPASPTIASSKLPHILSASTTPSTNHQPHHPNHHQRRRKPPPPKLPHILSDSSPCSTPRSDNFASNFFPTAHSTYSSTPSQTSSVWNWENFNPPPPPPPGSDYFDREQEHEDSTSQFSFKSRNSDVSYSRQQPQQQQKQPQTKTEAYQHQQHRQQQRYVNPTAHEVEGFDSERSEYDYFNEKLAMVEKNHNHGHGHGNHHLEEQTETEREEVECSEWGDHYSTTTSSEDDEEEEEEEDDDGVDGDVESRSEIGTRSNFGSSSAAKGYVAAVGKSEDLASSSTGEGVMDMKMVVRHRDLKEIVDSIKENFDKAAVAGDQVSDMLEISKAQLDRSFRQLRSEY